MTGMRRVTISLPGELDNSVLALKKEDRFVRCSYSEVVRQLLERGFQVLAEERGEEEE